MNLLKITSAFLLIFILNTSAFSIPTVGNVKIIEGNILTLTLSFDNTGLEEKVIDYFVVLVSEDKIYVLNGGEWVLVTNVNAVQSTLTEKAVAFNDAPSRLPDLPEGVKHSSIFFAVDLNPNGLMDFDSLFFDVKLF